MLELPRISLPPTLDENASELFLRIFSRIDFFYLIFNVFETYNKWCHSIFKM